MAEVSMAAVIFRLRNPAKTYFKSFSSSKRFKPKSLQIIWPAFLHISVSKGKSNSDWLRL